VLILSIGAPIAFTFINIDINVSFVLLSLLKTILMVLPLLIAVAYLTLLERKVMASMQRRKGPNVVGIFGLLQPLADGAKLLLKETVIPNSVNKGVFFLAPILTFFLAVMS
jgi:NADH:ubiquinone oxidoreductase subunit H